MDENPADIILDVTTVDTRSQKRRRKSKGIVDSIQQSYMTTGMYSQLLESIEEEDSAKSVEKAHRDGQEDARYKFPSNWFSEFKTLMWRQVCEPALRLCTPTSPL